MHVGFDLFDYIVINRRPLERATAARYARLGSRPVVADRPLTWAGRAQIVECDIAAECDGVKIRHAARPLARIIRALAQAGRQG